MRQRPYLVWSSDQRRPDAAEGQAAQEASPLARAAVRAGCDEAATIVRRVETIRLARLPHLVYVRVFGKDGHIGLGEAFGSADEVEAYIHHVVAPRILGRSPLHPDFDRVFKPLLRGREAGQRRGTSAVDIALWDLVGRVTGRSFADLLGGACRERIRIYDSPPPPTAPSATRSRVETSTAASFEQMILAHAEDLLARGITAMKIDPPIEPHAGSGGRDISPHDVERLVAPLREVRASFGHSLDIMLDLHSRWDVPAAKRIARAVEEVEPLWLEEPISRDDLRTLAAYARAVRLPMTLREPLSSRYELRDLFNRRIAGIVMFSLGWSGGVTAASRVAPLAAEYSLPLTLYGRAGPVLLAAATHVAVSAPNAVIQETVQHYVTHWYAEVAAELPDIANGTIAPPVGPGHGVRLRTGLLEDPATFVWAST